MDYTYQQQLSNHVKACLNGLVYSSRKECRVWLVWYDIRMQIIKFRFGSFRHTAGRILFFTKPKGYSCEHITIGEGSGGGYGGGVSILGRS